MVSDYFILFSVFQSPVQKNVSSGIAACEEIKNSQKLTKLKDTRDLNNQHTLLHYLVETIEQKIPEALNFGEELQHSKKASRINLVNIQEIMSKMQSSLDNLKSLLKDSKESRSRDDIFTDVMVDFAVQSSGQLVVLKEMIHKMQICHKEVAEYYTFNADKYPIETLFTDIEVFKESFDSAYKEIRNARGSQNAMKKMSQTCTTRKPSSHKLESVLKQQTASVRNDRVETENNILLKRHPDTSIDDNSMAIKKRREVLSEIQP